MQEPTARDLHRQDLHRQDPHRQDPTEEAGDGAAPPRILSPAAQRALAVTRALIEEGIPSSAVFAAAFGAEQAVASNADAEGRARNRRVEMSPVPRPQRAPVSSNGAPR